MSIDHTIADTCRTAPGQLARHSAVRSMIEHCVEYTEAGPLIQYRAEDTGEDVSPLPLYIPSAPPKAKTKKKAVQMTPAGGSDPSPIMVTFLNMATSTVYKMAGLGAFKYSQTYKTVMGETQEAVEEVKEVAAASLDDEEPEEEAEESDELVEKGTVALTETSTHWLLTVAGTCIDLDTETERGGGGKGVGRGEAGVESASLDLEDRWSQTLDLPRKKKGTQCDAINTAAEGVQASNIDIFESTQK